MLARKGSDGPGRNICNSYLALTQKDADMKKKKLVLQASKE